MERNNPTTSQPYRSNFQLPEGSQFSLADQFAAPYLHRSQEVLRTEWEGSRFFPATKQHAATEVSCVSHSAVPKRELLMGLDTVPLYNDQNGPDSKVWIQRATFYADKIVVYPEVQNPRCHQTPSDTATANLTRGRFNGYISRQSGIVLRKRLEPWIKCVQANKQEYKGSGKPRHSHIVFATLTLPADQEHGDNEIKRSVLMPFFQQLKRLHGVQEYFWSAEPQESGRIHFHVLFDRYIKGQALDDLWNSATDHLSYHSKYVQATGNFRAPSTQIRQCPPDMSLIKYILKYVSKQPEIRLSCMPKGYRSGGDHSFRPEYEQRHRSIGENGKVVTRDLERHEKVVSMSYWEHEVMEDGSWRYYERRPIEGRSWGMSKGLVQMKMFTQDVSYRVQDLISVAAWDPNVKMVSKEYVEIYYCNTVNLMLQHDPVLFSDYRRYHIQLYKNLYFPQSVTMDELVKVFPLEFEDPPPEVKKEYRQLRFAC